MADSSIQKFLKEAGIIGEAANGARQFGTLLAGGSPEYRAFRIRGRIIDRLGSQIPTMSPELQDVHRKVIGQLQSTNDAYLAANPNEGGKVLAARGLTGATALGTGVGLYAKTQPLPESQEPVKTQFNWKKFLSGNVDDIATTIRGLIPE